MSVDDCGDGGSGWWMSECLCLIESYLVFFFLRAPKKERTNEGDDDDLIRQERAHSMFVQINQCVVRAMYGKAMIAREWDG